ncbi:MAG TPA: redoxin domain-containing protein [Draconibacterium sp.]|nr:redoxin domain-containing protein [Draconibacterium sp.]
MKRLVFILMILFSGSAFAGNNTGNLEIGEKAVLTDVKMTDVSGNNVSIDDVKKENGVLVLFSSNVCPFVKKWEGRYNDLKTWADKNNFGMIVLNSNYQKRDGVESLEAMKEKAAEIGYNFHYVVDSESLIANAFGGQTTPHAFIFDKDYNLVYKGAIDDNYDSASDVTNAYVKNVMTNLSKGETVAVSETKPVGCSIKRKLIQ